MAKVCESCGKRPRTGHLVSHSNIKTLRRFEPNLRKQHFFDKKTGKMVLRKICVSCMRTMVKPERKKNPKSPRKSK